MNTLQTYIEHLRQQTGVQGLMAEGSERIKIPLPRGALVQTLVIRVKDLPGRGRVTTRKDLDGDFLVLRPKIGDSPGFSLLEIRGLLDLISHGVVKHDPALRAQIKFFLGME